MRLVRRLRQNSAQSLPFRISELYQRSDGAATRIMLKISINRLRLWGERLECGADRCFFTKGDCQIRSPTFWRRKRHRIAEGDDTPRT